MESALRFEERKTPGYRIAALRDGQLLAESASSPSTPTAATGSAVG